MPAFGRPPLACLLACLINQSKSRKKKLKFTKSSSTFSKKNHPREGACSYLIFQKQFGQKTITHFRYISLIHLNLIIHGHVRFKCPKNTNLSRKCEFLSYSWTTGFVVTDSRKINFNIFEKF